VYQPELITKAEEQQALAVLEAMAFSTITMHGRTARRTVRHFGLDYGYESWKLVPTDPLPGELAWLQERAGVLAGLDPGDFAQILISSRVGRLDPLPALAGRRRSGIGAGGGVLGRQLAAPRLGLIVAGLAAAAAGWGLRFRLSPDAVAWRRGAAGERRTARLLDPLERHGWAILHDLAIPSSQANIDCDDPRRGGRGAV